MSQSESNLFVILTVFINQREHQLLEILPLLNELGACITEKFPLW